MWSGHQSCFDKAFEYILNYNLNDKKGLNGDEYYLVSAIQRCNTKINPLDYKNLKFVNFGMKILDFKKMN